MPPDVKKDQEDIKMNGPEERYFIRMTPSQRIQHITIVISTSLLIITGFLIQAEAFVINSLGGFSETFFFWRGWIHRIAGVIAITACVYHMIYVVVTKEGRSWFIDMILRPKDLLNVFQNISYMLGFREAKPKMDRFFYLEKLEYWSVWFGMFIVIVTGIMLWTEYLWPKFYLEIASTFHIGEATLATLAIIVGHIYVVHYSTHVYPINKTFIDGRISEHMMKEEHMLQYEREKGLLDETVGDVPQVHGGEKERLIDDYYNAIKSVLAFVTRKPKAKDTEDGANGNA